MNSLFIGINYRYTNNSRIKLLSNAVKDAKRAYKYIKFNYPNTCVKILVDVEKFQTNDFDNNDIIYPSRQNIIKALKWISNCDKAFFHFSGHALPEGIVPADYKSDGDLIDLKKYINPVIGMQIFCVFDTCHSSALLNVKTYDNIFIVCINSCSDEEKSNDSNSFSNALYKFLNNKFLFFKKSKKSWREASLFINKYFSQSPNIVSNNRINLEKNIFEL